LFYLFVAGKQRITIIINNIILIIKKVDRMTTVIHFSKALTQRYARGDSERMHDAWWNRDGLRKEKNL